MSEQGSYRSALMRIGLYPVDDYPSLPRPHGEVPKDGVYVPESLFLLDDKELFDFHQNVSQLRSFAEEQLGAYNRHLIYAESELRRVEREGWTQLWPEGKPKTVTVEQSKMTIASMGEVAQARDWRDYLTAEKEAAYGMKEAYLGLVFASTSVINYRRTSHDKMPYEPTNSGKTSFKF